MTTSEVDLEYTPVVERLLRLPNTWPENVTVEIAQLNASIRELQEGQAWLENEIGSLRQENDALRMKIAAQGRKLGQVARDLQGRV